MAEAVKALSQVAGNKRLNSLLSRLQQQAAEHGEAPQSRWLKADTPSNRERVEALRWQVGPVSLDASKQQLDVPTLELLLEWVALCGLDRQRSALFAGGRSMPARGELLCIPRCVGHRTSLHLPAASRR